jgi:predicted PhzF superfamily epimerase YddE/YHI9
MGRQSFVHIAMRVGAGGITDIRIGGKVVPVRDGTIRLS